MIHTDKRFNQAVEDAVGRLEAHTDAEVVVVAAGRSGSYRDVAYAAASAASLSLLVVMLYIPYVVPPWGVLVEILLCWVFCAWLVDGPRGIRWLTSKGRRDRQARAAAEAEFHRESVHATPQRTGVLVYVSGLESAIVVLPDLGIEGRVPPGEWRMATAAFVHQDLDHFLEGLHGLGEVLARHVPPRDDPNRLELPDAPRVRP